MPIVVIDGSYCTGHGSFPPRQNSSCSQKFFVEGKGVVRVGDTWSQHCSGPSCHTGTQETGSSKLFVEGKAVARKGDSINTVCDSLNDTGSTKMFSES